MKRLVRSKLSSQQGNTIVEAALVLLLALTIIIGILDMGQMLILHQALVERVRAGARYAVVNDWTLDSSTDQQAEQTIRNIVAFNEALPGNRTGQSGILGIKPDMVNVTRQDLALPPDPGNPLAGVPFEGADRITVSLTGYSFFFLTPGLTGRYMMKPISRSIAVESLGFTP